MTDETLYEAEVADLKSENQRKRILIGSIHIALEVVVLVVLYAFFGLNMIIVYVVFATLFLPSPFSMR